MTQSHSHSHPNIAPEFQSLITLTSDFIIESFARLLHVPPSRLSVEYGNTEVHDAVWVYIDQAEDPYYFEHAFYAGETEPSYSWVFVMIDQPNTPHTQGSFSVELSHPEHFIRGDNLARPSTPPA